MNSGEFDVLEKKKYFIVSDLTKCRAAIFACESVVHYCPFLEKGEETKNKEKTSSFLSFQ